MPIKHVRVIDTNKSHYLVGELPLPVDWNTDHTGTLDQSDVTNLVSDLANKSDVGHTHEGGSGDMTKAVYDPANKNAQLAAVTDLAVDTNLSAAAQDAITKRHANTLDHDGSTQDTAIAGKAATSHAHVATDVTGTAILTADARLSDDRTPTSHDNTKHSATYITTSSVTYEILDANADVGTSAGQLAIGNHTHPGGSEAFPVGAVFLSVVSTNPNTLLGYGTWSAIAAGRMLIGLDSGDTDFDTVEETGGAKTKTIAQANLPNISTGAGTSHNHTQDSHSHLTQRYPTSTGGSSGFTIDTSMSGTLADNTLPTKVATATNQAEAAHTHSLGGSGTALDVVNPYFVVYIWKRTA